MSNLLTKLTGAVAIKGIVFDIEYGTTTLFDPYILRQPERYTISVHGNVCHYLLVYFTA